MAELPVRNKLIVIFKNIYYVYLTEYIMLLKSSTCTYHNTPLVQFPDEVGEILCVTSSASILCTKMNSAGSSLLMLCNLLPKYRTNSV